MALTIFSSGGQALHADKTRRPLAPLLVSELQLLQLQEVLPLAGV